MLQKINLFTFLIVAATISELSASSTGAESCSTLETEHGEDKSLVAWAPLLLFFAAKTQSVHPSIIYAGFLYFVFT